MSLRLQIVNKTPRKNVAFSGKDRVMSASSSRKVVISFGHRQLVNARIYRVNFTHRMDDFHAGSTFSAALPEW